jgi:hypothetical protein
MENTSIGIKIQINDIMHIHKIGKKIKKLKWYKLMWYFF